MSRWQPVTIDVAREAMLGIVVCRLDGGLEAILSKFVESTRVEQTRIF